MKLEGKWKIYFLKLHERRNNMKKKHETYDKWARYNEKVQGRSETLWNLKESERYLLKQYFVKAKKYETQKKRTVKLKCTEWYVTKKYSCETKHFETCGSERNYMNYYMGDEKFGTYETKTSEKIEKWNIAYDKRNNLKLEWGERCILKQYMGETNIFETKEKLKKKNK